MTPLDAKHLILQREMCISLMLPNKNEDDHVSSKFELAPVFLDSDWNVPGHDYADDSDMASLLLLCSTVFLHNLSPL